MRPSDGRVPTSRSVVQTSEAGEGERAATVPAAEWQRGLMGR